MEESKNLAEEFNWDDILSDEEVKTLIKQLAKGQKEFSDVDVIKVVEWAKGIAIQKALLDMVLEGELVIRLDENSEAIFKKTE